ncbi:Piezo-type mechanosensitive ion channel component [Trichinella pseudospiralis]
MSPDSSVLSTFSSIKLVLRKVVMLNGVFALSSICSLLCGVEIDLYNSAAFQVLLYSERIFLAYYCVV